MRFLNTSAIIVIVLLLFLLFKSELLLEISLILITILKNKRPIIYLKCHNLSLEFSSPPFAP